VHTDRFKYVEHVVRYVRPKNVGFVLGFIAGEGSFHIKLSEQKGYLYARPGFTLSAAEVDADLVREIKELVGLGSIYERDHEIRWRFTSREECQKFAEQILSAAEGTLFLESAKYEQFQRWLDFAANCEQPETIEEAREVVKWAKSVPSTHKPRGQSVEEWMEKLKYPQE